MNDLISRQAAIDAVNRLSLGETDAVRLTMRIVDYLNRMPPAQPERKKGKWIRHDEIKNVYVGIYIECSECKRLSWNMENYCGNCGARMDGENDE